MGLQGFSSSQFGVQESHVLLLLPDIMFTAEEMKQIFLKEEKLFPGCRKNPGQLSLQLQQLRRLGDVSTEKVSVPLISIHCDVTHYCSQKVEL